jgi:hypothetical protein
VGQSKEHEIRSYHHALYVVYIYMKVVTRPLYHSSGQPKEREIRSYHFALYVVYIYIKIVTHSLYHSSGQH